MNYLEACRCALASLVANPLRSFLTLLGVIIGVTAIIAVIAVIRGLDQHVAENLSDLGPGVFVISKFGLITNRDDFLEALRRNRDLREGDVAALRQRAYLAAAVGAEAHMNAEVRHGDRSVQDVDIGGLTPEVLLIEPYDVARGRTITREEGERAAPVAFLGHDVAERLFGLLEPVGRKVRIRGLSFEVVGVAARRGSVFGVSRDGYVKIPLAAHRKLFGPRRSLNISVKAASLPLLEAAMDQCRVVLRARHRLRYAEKDDFGLVSADGINSLWRDLTRIIFNVAVFVVGLSLVVGGIVIMNIMLVSVVERTREIGIRKAVGARARDIRRQFLVEAVLLSCTGGAIGVALAWLISLAVGSLTPLPAAFPLWAPLLAFSICTAIGIFFGLQPAARAAHLDPIQALRGER